MRYILICISFWVVVASLCVKAEHPAASKITKVTKSENDSREYRYLTLTNSLRVLLISDPQAEKSAAAINIHVGSHQDPKGRLGLAHLLEHMLLLGTEKYPDAHDYQDFISQHGGTNNAFTGNENTAYYFDVTHAALESSLDRFAEAFVTPTFNPNNIEQELQSINAEYLANIMDDGRREWDVYATQFNANHPASNFSIGNLETLGDEDNKNIRDDLIAFFQNYYSANLMSLAVLSNRKLDELQKMVEHRFVQIPNTNKVISGDYPNLFKSQSLPLSLNVKSVKEVRQLSVVFPVPSYANRYQTKPWSYFARLLGSEAPGSILALLKSLGWAESLSVGEIYSSRRDSLVALNINFTKEGVKARDQIVSVVFDVINNISARGITEWRFAELQQMAELNFRYSEKKSPVETVTALAQAVQDYPAVSVLWGKYAYTSFDEPLLKKALSYLREDNVFVSLRAPEVPTDERSPFYQAAFSVNAGIADILQLKPPYHQRLSLPERNIFIPKNMALKTQSILAVQDDQKKRNLPVLVTNNDQLKMWFMQDKVFRLPKAELNVRFKLPTLNHSLENAARAQLFSALICDQLNEYAYPARLAGLEFTFNANARGLELKVSGYSDKHSLLVSKIFAAIAQAEFDPKRFAKLKESLIRDWRDEDKDLPSNVLAKKVPRLQLLPYWGVKEYIDLLQATNFDAFNQFAQGILRGARIDALLFGNLYEQDAIKLSALMEHKLLQKKSNRLPQLAKVLRPENDNDKSWLYSYPIEHNDHVAELYVQAQGPYVEDSAHMQLITHILAPKFLNELRTEKQLGYIVEVYSLPIRGVEGSFFVVQSPNVNAEALIGEISRFLAAAAAQLTDSFEENKAALIAQLGQRPLSLAAQSDEYWQSILLNDTDFNRQQKLVTAVGKITPESINKYYEIVFLQKKRRLWLIGEKINNAAEYDSILNVAEYQKKMQGYLSP